MARADLLVRLVHAANRGNRPLFKRTVEALIAEERGKRHHVLARRLEEAVQPNGHPTPIAAPKPPNAVEDLLLEVDPERSVEDLILGEETRCLFGELVEEQERLELLRSYGLEPRHRILLVGPPGNGKTSFAEALAQALMLPLLVVRYEAVIASYLGETSSRLRRLFDHVRGRRCVLFFDEFDTLGKERGDEHETGEIKRVVSTLLLQIDQLPSHVVVVTATNHPELLDRAVWRRFQVRLELPLPDRQAIRFWLERLHQRTGLVLQDCKALIEATAGWSFGELEELARDIHRRQVLAEPGGDLHQTVARRLEQWRARYLPG